jgi:hypothetical protein
MKEKHFLGLIRKKTNKQICILQPAPNMLIALYLVKKSQEFSNALIDESILK